MTSISHDPAAIPRERPDWKARVLVREMWASLAITMMWLAVLVDAVWGPDIYTHSNDGSGATIPSAVVVVVFAWLGTAVVAKTAFGSRAKD
jgi:hypothetical protein